MMINKRLIGAVPESKRYIAGNVAAQWIALIANAGMMGSIAMMLQWLYQDAMNGQRMACVAAVGLCALAIRLICTLVASRMSYLSARTVKATLREAIYTKLLRLGASYSEQVRTSEVVQVAVEGVDQLETYFGAYLPQFFYAMLAPVTLFVMLCWISIPAAVVLLVCVPMIPVAIAAVQTWAKKLLSRYWGQYTQLGDTFLENLQGLTTLKIYRTDALQHQKMNEESERFRRITMKVLTMQLNSITIMDLIAYGGAALGMGMAVSQFAAGHVSLAGALLIILLSADFFIPMRQLGSFFHVAMNVMAASDKIFRLLDLPEQTNGTQDAQADALALQDVSFGYEKDRRVLQHVSMNFPKGSFTAIVGESGCGKSTVASLMVGRNRGYSGSVTLGGTELSNIREDALMRTVTYVGHASNLFKGTVRENLQMGKPDSSDEALWAMLERVRLADFFRCEQGLDTQLTEQAGNLSGGQRQRLALARALLHDSPVYIFDEATSNIDVESENDMMAQIRALIGVKTVILISHRLANVTGADQIYVMQDGRVVEQGAHMTLPKGGVYDRLWTAQQALEQYTNKEEKA